jgi:aspartokinase-like uncharacterized kinase
VREQGLILVRKVEERSRASDSTSGKALVLIANEAGLELCDLTDDAAFATLGVDSENHNLTIILLQP